MKKETTIKNMAIYMTEREIRGIMPYQLQKEYRRQWRLIFANFVTPLYEMLPKEEQKNFHFSVQNNELTCYIMAKELGFKLRQFYSEEKIIEMWHAKK